jgi:hypothetical protein
LKFDDPAIKAIPADLTAMIPGLVERLRQRRSNRQSEPLPAGFADPDD